MPNSTSERLKRNIHKIMDLWVERALKEVAAAHHQENLALRNSIPEYLGQLVNALSTTIDRTEVRKQWDKAESKRVGKKHGVERAGSYNYTLDQVIFEYHILRQVVCDVMESEEPLTPAEREVIVSSIEQAVNDAATEYSRTLRDIQDQLTQTLAHDFRTPLSSAKFNLQLILRRPDDEENIMNKATRASVSLDRLDRMIQDLLDASRMKTGSRLVVEFSENCDLNWIIKEVAGELDVNFENKIQIVSSGHCLGKWNEKGLRRVIENLTSNAVKYGKANTPVTITLNQDENFAELSVHNDGDPIPEDEISILFQQFRRSRSAEKKIGWGLGLSVVKGMTDAHKGKIEVISEKGKGTTFTIKLPKNPEHVL